MPKRPVANTLVLLALWIAFYASFTLFKPALLDDADSVHAEVAREMLLRHDWVTLYANGIRYLEKAPLLYWSMAGSFLVFGVNAAAARIPLALTVLALAFAVESFARRAFRNARAGLYAALILLSCPGLFLFTRILLPDALVCLWLALALLCFWLSEESAISPEDKFVGQKEESTDSEVVLLSVAKDPRIFPERANNLRFSCYSFASCCALGVLSKGLIGALFPVGIVAIYLLCTRGWSATAARIRQLHPLSSLAVFLSIAAPWHILIALANTTQGYPGGLTFARCRFAVPLPTDGNVHGWLWFYFVNEQLLRYLNLRVPRDYDTVPLWLFWGLCLIWLAPWSAFVFRAIGGRNSLRHTLLKLFPCDRSSMSWHSDTACSAGEESPHSVRCGTVYPFSKNAPERRANAPLLLLVWAGVPLLFFSFSTRQEYYILPALPALAILVASWLARDSEWKAATQSAQKIRRANLRITAVLVAVGAIFATCALVFLLHLRASAPNADLAQLLQQNPADYALSMGHFLDLNATALGLFRLPLALAAAALLFGPLASFILRKKNQPHTATLALAAGAFAFLLAAHLGLQTFAPVLSSQQLAAAIAPQIRADDLVVIHQEYEFASTLGFYLRRNDIHILEGRSSNLWYGSFFRDAPAIFETPQSLAQKWPGPQRIFLCQDLGNQPSALPTLPAPVYVIAKSSGKEIVSNRSAH
ncbi:MAG: phospholipid carrier-dependent glycosyltransferase [Acidobacteriaceae bacterium]|nr:phospholipid carrier-dependent glycosyltransferase [Acidobacteriaceae bacterium]